MTDLQRALARPAYQAFNPSLAAARTLDALSTLLGTAADALRRREAVQRPRGRVGPAIAGRLMAETPDAWRVR